MGRQKKGRCSRKNKQRNAEESQELVNAPHSFIIHRGLPGDHIVELTKDFRKVMEPFTATDLKERRKNTIKDFVSVSGLLHVTHLCIFSKSEIGMYLKIARLPRGPTLSFKLMNFSLSRDVVSALKKQMVFEEAFKTSPLMILNNFTGEGKHMKLMTTTFQNMFPTINLTTINLSTIRRCICLNYNRDDKTLDFRHYAIKVVPVGLSKGVKKIVQAKIPDLSKCEDISDFLTQPTMSESEGEDDEASHVTLPQKLSSRGNHQKGTSAIKLYELGPRLTLQLIKIEDGLMDGAVLFHELIQKTDEEVEKIQKLREQKKKLKEKRKKDQEDNKMKKETKKQEHKEKSMQGIRKKRERDDLLKKLAKESYEETKQEDDDDEQYYKDEVGEQPDKDLFQKKPGFKRKTFEPKYKSKSNKKVKFSNNVKE